MTFFSQNLLAWLSNAHLPFLFQISTQYYGNFFQQIMFCLHRNDALVKDNFRKRESGDQINKLGSEFGDQMV